jgi:uncharacterized protein DUF4154
MTAARIPRPRAGLRSWLAAASALWMATASAEPYREDAVKAAFLNRFTAYVEWPTGAANRPEFRVAVLGAPLVAEELRRQLADRTIKNRPVRIDAVTSAAEAREAQILYVGAGWPGDPAAVAKSLGARPVLLVTDRPRGLDEGGAINFLLIDQRVRFEVSLIAAQHAGLRINSQLLGVAVRVRGRYAEDTR